MITPKEKAKELFDKFKEFASWGGMDEDPMYRDDNAKQCVLILVEEIIKENHAHAIYYKDLGIMQQYLIDWQLVKQEIEKL